MTGSLIFLLILAAFMSPLLAGSNAYRDGEAPRAEAATGAQAPPHWMGDEEMSKICHAHCPDESGALLAALTVILAAVLAVIAAQVVESLFVVIVITGSVLIAAGTCLFIWLVRRDRISPPARARAITGRVVQVAPPRAAQALSAPRRREIEAPRRQDCTEGSMRSERPHLTH